MIVGTERKVGKRVAFKELLRPCGAEQLLTWQLRPVFGLSLEGQFSGELELPRIAVLTSDVAEVSTKRGTSAGWIVE